MIESQLYPLRETQTNGNERILLVEDDADVRTFFRDVLENCGYQIFEAENGVAALRIWKESLMQFDLLLTDIMMPGGISGYALAYHLRDEKPSLKIVLTSGFTPQSPERIQPDMRFLQKPCSVEALIETVESCLMRRG